MSSTERTITVEEFSLDAQHLSKSAINAVRVAFGVAGVVALVLGIVLLVEPVKTFTVVAIILGINFLVVGIVRVALSIFTSGASAGLRVLNILFGVLLIIVGIVAIKNSAVAAELLVIFVVVLIGIGWIIEGVLALVESGKSESRSWAIIFGVISVLAGITVLLVPVPSALVLILISGISLVALGIVGILRAFTFGKAALQKLG